MTHLGAIAPSVARIVLDCVPACVWGEEVSKTSAQAVAWLAAAFYDPEIVRVRPGKLLTFGPSRGSYSVTIEPEASPAPGVDTAQPA